MQAAKTYFLIKKLWFKNNRIATWFKNRFQNRLAEFTPLQELQYLGEKLWQLK
jgi:nuclear transport factor 2 (NTF2) superfamily protein